MTEIKGSDIHKIVLACEAGRGSSVMVVSQLRQRLKDTGVEVVHSPASRIPTDADVIMCHRGLEATARNVAPGTVVVPFDLFIGDPAFDRVVQAIKQGQPIEG
jgi:mannitol-specific phosphotransferase system IIBC component